MACSSHYCILGGKMHWSYLTVDGADDAVLGAKHPNVEVDLRSIAREVDQARL